MTDEIKVQLTVSEKGADSAGAVADSLRSVVKNAGDAVSALGPVKRDFAEIAGAYTKLTIGKNVLEALAGTVGAVDQVAQGMGKIRTVLDEKTMPSAQLQALIHNVAEQTGQDFKSIATIIRDVVAQGYDPATVANEEFLLGLTKFQRVAETTDAQMSGLVKGLNNMHVGGTQTATSLDKIAAIADASSANMGDFTNIMVNAGAVAHLSGQSFEDIAMVAALVSNNFKGGAEEATSLRNALVKLMDPKTIHKLGSELGIEVEDANHQLRRLPDILLDVEKATRSKGTGALMSIFGPKQGAVLVGGAINALRDGLQISGEEARKGSAIFERYNDILNNSSGAVTTKFSAATQNMTDQLLMLKQAAVGLASELFGTFGAGMIHVVAGIKDAVSSFRQFLEAHPIIAGFVSVIATGLGVVAALGGALLALGGFAGLARYAFTELRTILWSVTEAQLASAAAAKTQAVALEGAAVAAEASAGANAAAGATGAASRLGQLGATAGRAGGYLAVAAIAFEIGGAIGKAIAHWQAKSVDERQSKIIDSFKTAYQPLTDVQMAAAKSFEESTGKFRAIIDKFEGGVIKEFPVLSDRVVGVAEQLIADRGKTPLGALPSHVAAGLMSDIRTGVASIKEGTNTPEQTEALVHALQQVGYYGRAEQRVGVGGAKGRVDFVIDQALKQLHESLSPEMLAAVAYDKQLMTPATDNGAPIPWLTKKPKGAALNAPINQGSGFPSMGTGTWRTEQAAMGNVTMKNVSFGTTPFNLFVDGQLIRAAMNAGNQRELAENLRGAR